MINTYLYIIDNGGIDTASSYPYKSKVMSGSVSCSIIAIKLFFFFFFFFLLRVTTQQYYCKFSSSNVGAKATGFVLISSGSESDLMSAVATVGPVAVHIDANNNAFQVGEKVYVMERDVT